MILRGENWKRYLKIYFFTVMRKITVALNQAITYNDTQSKYIGRLRNWIDVLSVALTGSLYCPSTADAA